MPDCRAFPQLSNDPLQHHKAGRLALLACLREPNGSLTPRQEALLAHLLNYVAHHPFTLISRDPAEWRAVTSLVTRIADMPCYTVVVLNPFRADITLGWEPRLW